MNGGRVLASQLCDGEPVNDSEGANDLNRKQRRFSTGRWKTAIATVGSMVVTGERLLVLGRCRKEDMKPRPTLNQ
ncbi:hypothetical protein NL676_029435 [Syzygium grande]|nr:hypothetical protein NL676_029435 [Syzygium grande]